MMLTSKFIKQELAPKMIKRVLPLIGRIKIGIKKPYKKGDKVIYLPQKLDHFIITKNIRDESGNFVVDHELMEKIAQKTGQDPNKLTMIPIIFPYIKPELNMQIWLRSFENGKPFCRGNGETGERWEEGRTIKVDCPCERYNLPDGDPRKCKMFARLNVIIREANQFGGVWTFYTTGQRSVLSLFSQLGYFNEQLGGPLSQYVFMLVLNQEKVIMPDGVTRTVPYVHIVYNPEYDNIEDTPIYKFIRKGLQINKEEIQERIKHEEKMLEWMPQVILEEEEKHIDEIQEEFFPTEEAREILEQIEEKDEEKDKEKDSEVKPETKPAVEEKQVKMSNPAQVQIIQRELSKLDFEDKEYYLSKLDELTYEQAAKVISLLKLKNHRDAILLLKEFILPLPPEEDLEGIVIDEDIAEITEDDIPF